jgi:NTP pyrophosphatase (non-canonical NTP hydrolase)
VSAQRQFAMNAAAQLRRRTVSIHGEVTVEFAAYQRAASETSQLNLGGPHGAIAPMLGLASEMGSILNVYKKYLRDGIDLAANREFLREELGDLLWYAAAVATACDLDLEDIAEANLRRTRDRYPRPDAGADCGPLPVFDAAYPVPSGSWQMSAPGVEWADTDGYIQRSVTVPPCEARRLVVPTDPLAGVFLDAVSPGLKAAS